MTPCIHSLLALYIADRAKFRQCFVIPARFSHIEQTGRHPRRIPSALGIEIGHGDLVEEPEGIASMASHRRIGGLA
jgi:hypothetical protein